MAKAEVAGIGRQIEVETCSHAMCSCKGSLDDSPARIDLIANAPQVEGGMISTPLDLYNGSYIQTISVSGVKRPEVIAEAFNRCEGPQITSEGIICGAIHSLGRK